MSDDDVDLEFISMAESSDYEEPWSMCMTINGYHQETDELVVSEHRYAFLTTFLDAVMRNSVSGWRLVDDGSVLLGPSSDKCCQRYRHLEDRALIDDDMQWFLLESEESIEILNREMSAREWALNEMSEMRDESLLFKDYQVE